jgi:hypothetical protein
MTKGFEYAAEIKGEGENKIHNNVLLTDFWSKSGNNVDHGWGFILQSHKQSLLTNAFRIFKLGNVSNIGSICL